MAMSHLHSSACMLWLHPRTPAALPTVLVTFILITCIPRFRSEVFLREHKQHTH